MNPVFSATLWLSAYLTLVLAPLLTLLIGPVPPGSGFWWDFSMALGFAGMALLGLQFLLTARFRRASAPFGIDIIYYFHRFLAVIGFMLILTHIFIIWINNPAALGTSNPMVAPWYMTAGRAALLLFTIIIATSLWRKQLHIEYDHWRLWHALLATAAFLLAMVHIEGVGYYINAPVKRVLWTVFTLFWVLLIIYVRLIKPARLRKMPYRVTEVRPERGKVWTLVLKPDGHPGLGFSCGQFAWLTLGESPFHVREHPFSIASSAERSESLEFTIKELGDFTHTIKDRRPGEIAYLDGPYGAFTVERYPHSLGFVFIAGGVGIAPIMSMLRTLADRGERRPLLLIYGNQDWERVTFREELTELQKLLTLQVVHVLTEPPANWKGASGYIGQELLNNHLPPNRGDLEYFICGPAPMRNAAERALHHLQISIKRVHAELFDLV
ncbi:ferredoxin reductase family protein [Kaarinaea lacus]